MLVNFRELRHLITGNTVRAIGAPDYIGIVFNENLHVLYRHANRQTCR